MTTVADALPPRPIEWGLAFRGLVGLARDTSRTDHVFTIIQALSGNAFEHTYQEFKRTPHGQRLLRERPSLMALLADRERLRAMPEGSLAREYLLFMKDGQLTADGLVEAQNAGIDPHAHLDLDEKRRYFGDRLRDMHDLWHVLTEYGSDDTGEIANLWFSVGQFTSYGMAFIAFFGAIDGVIDLRFGWPRYCLRAYLRGRRAERIASAPVEEMLHLPIDEVRRRLRILPTERVHPEGIRFGYRKDRRMGAIPSQSRAA
jgi:ubiquinone biosynthesis protein COQ4